MRERAKKDAFENARNASLSQNLLREQVDVHLRKTIWRGNMDQSFMYKMIGSFDDQMMIHSSSKKEAVHNDIYGTFSKILCNFELDRLIVTLKNLVYNDYSWAQTIIKNIVNMDHISCKR